MRKPREQRTRIKRFLRSSSSGLTVRTRNLRQRDPRESHECCVGAQGRTDGREGAVIRPPAPKPGVLSVIQCIESLAAPPSLSTRPAASDRPRRRFSLARVRPRCRTPPYAERFPGIVIEADTEHPGGRPCLQFGRPRTQPSHRRRLPPRRTPSRRRWRKRPRPKAGGNPRPCGGPRCSRPPWPAALVLQFRDRDPDNHPREARQEPDLVPAQSVAPFLFPGNDRSHRHSASAERRLAPVGDVAGGGASFGAFADTPRVHPPFETSDAAPAASSRLTTRGAKRVPAVDSKPTPDIRPLKKPSRPAG